MLPGTPLDSGSHRLAGFQPPGFALGLLDALVVIRERLLHRDAGRTAIPPFARRQVEKSYRLVAPFPHQPISLSLLSPPTLIPCPSSTSASLPFLFIIPPYPPSCSFSLPQPLPFLICLTPYLYSLIPSSPFSKLISSNCISLSPLTSVSLPLPPLHLLSLCISFFLPSFKTISSHFLFILCVLSHLPSSTPTFLSLSPFRRSLKLPPLTSLSFPAPFTLCLPPSTLPQNSFTRCLPHFSSPSPSPSLPPQHLQSRERKEGKEGSVAGSHERKEGKEGSVAGSHEKRIGRIRSRKARLKDRKKEAWKEEKKN